MANDITQVPQAVQPRPIKLRSSRRVGGFLWGMRVRKKVLFLHTLFFLGLAAILLVPLRPAITEVVEQAEINEARLILKLALATPGEEVRAWRESIPEAFVSKGSSQSLGLDPATVSLARGHAGRPVGAYLGGVTPCAVAFRELGGR
jgi:hypothetical protein